MSPLSVTTCAVVAAPGKKLVRPFSKPPPGLSPRPTVIVPQLKSTLRPKVWVSFQDLPLMEYQKKRKKKSPPVLKIPASIHIHPTFQLSQVKPVHYSPLSPQQQLLHSLGSLMTTQPAPFGSFWIACSIWSTGKDTALWSTAGYPTVMPWTPISSKFHTLPPDKPNQAQGGAYRGGDTVTSSPAASPDTPSTSRSVCR